MARNQKKPRVTGADDADPDRLRGKITFPLRVGAIDVGSNAMRLMIAEFDSVSAYKILESQRVPVRLGHDVFLTGRLTETAMGAAVAALAEFRGRLEFWETAHHRAVTTSAVRESKNGEEFLARVRTETGMDLTVITGSEEARLVYLAVKSRIDLGRDNWITVDLGGGSVEVSLVSPEGILWSESHTMGSVRLLEELSDSGIEPGRFRNLLAEYISTLKIPLFAGPRKLAGLIATGGSMEQLARLSGALPDAQGVSRVTTGQLRAVIELLSVHSYRQRIEKFGLREDQADVILPAAMVYERLAASAGIELITVPHVGVKDGVVLDIVEDLVTHRAHRDRQEREILAGAIHLGQRYMFDEAHGRHVARLALSIHDQLQAMEVMDGDDRLLLQAAALLHDIGTYISYKKHHRHSLYIISQSELPNLTPRQMQMVAIIARYHRKGEPSTRHGEYAQLSGGERSRVNRLAAILRVADALDREHRQRVTGVTLSSANGNEILIRLDGDGDLLIERWAIVKKIDLFGKIFNRRLRVQAAEVNHESS
jgi:exopolyphosphatase/guanosine-5'-triphosphate,3'-diphosphate pyrophosphatase